MELYVGNGQRCSGVLKKIVPTSKVDLGVSQHFSILVTVEFAYAHANYSGRCRMRKDHILPQQRIIGRPFCEFCKAQMWLACIEPDEPDHDKRTFECPMCPNITVRVVKYRSSNSDLEIKLVSRRT